MNCISTNEIGFDVRAQAFGEEVDTISTREQQVQQETENDSKSKKKTQAEIEMTVRPDGTSSVKLTHDEDGVC